MNWADGFIAVDWGTTNRRAYQIDSSGTCVSEISDDQGVLAVGKGGFEAAVAHLRARTGDRPMLLAGMIGSNRGWIEVPYVDCPAGLDDLARSLAETPGDRALIVPGLAYRDGRCDVMRGEEVQILGAAAAGEIPEGCLVCHPGTHNKWCRLEAGKVTAFRTVMTGELFSLLKSKSILSDLLREEATVGAAFEEGVSRGLEGAGITAELFGARARVLLGCAQPAEIASFISGLLIGEDVRAGLRGSSGGPVFVMGRSDLTKLYSAALAEAGVNSEQVSGERAFIAGARHIVERIQ